MKAIRLRPGDEITVENAGPHKILHAKGGRLLVRDPSGLRFVIQARRVRGALAPGGVGVGPWRLLVQARKDPRRRGR